MREKTVQKRTCAKLVSAGTIPDAIVGLVRVLRLGLMVKVATTALLRGLGIDHGRLGATPPATAEQGGDCEYEGDNLRGK